MTMGLFNFVHHKASEILRRFHKESADPLKLPEPIRRGVWDIRAMMFLPFVESKEVLELGCGYGYNAFLFSKKAKIVLGVDMNGEAIEKARENYKEVGNLNFVREDALSFLEKTEQKFDVVALFEFIEHLDVAKQKELLKQIGIVLKPKGELFLSTPNGRIVPFYRKNPFHKRELSVEELLELLRDDYKVEENKGQIPLFWLFVPLPWAWLERLWIWLGIYERIHKMSDKPEKSRSVILRATRKKPWEIRGFFPYQIHKYAILTGRLMI